MSKRKGPSGLDEPPRKLPKLLSALEAEIRRYNPASMFDFINSGVESRLQCIRTLTQLENTPEEKRTRTWLVATFTGLGTLRHQLVNQGDEKEGSPTCLDVVKRLTDFANSLGFEKARDALFNKKRAYTPRYIEMAQYIIDTIPGRSIEHCDDCMRYIIREMDCDFLQLLVDNGVLKNPRISGFREPPGMFASEEYTNPLFWCDIPASEDSIRRPVFPDCCVSTADFVARYERMHRLLWRCIPFYPTDENPIPKLNAVQYYVNFILHVEHVDLRRDFVEHHLSNNGFRMSERTMNAMSAQAKRQLGRRYPDERQIRVMIFNSLLRIYIEQYNNARYPNDIRQIHDMSHYLPKMEDILKILEEEME